MRGICLMMLVVGFVARPALRTTAVCRKDSFASTPWITTSSNQKECLMSRGTRNACTTFSGPMRPIVHAAAPVTFPALPRLCEPEVLSRRLLACAIEMT